MTQEELINLEKILFQANKNAFYEEGYNNYFTSIQQNIIRKAMLEFGKQLLELASENLELHCEDKFANIKYNTNFEDADGLIITVNKQSIIDTIKQVE